jgi:tetratricopeptide (TPR) repeat protein
VATTPSEKALAFYRQGVAYLHSFVWIEAARSFHEAIRLDPKMAMAYVGLSRTYSNLSDEAAARSSLAKAQALAAQASPRERRRIEILRKQIDAIADLSSREKHLEYKKAIDDALVDDRDDAELWLLRGNAEEPAANGRGQGGGAASIPFYEAALARQPDYFAAHHYLTHSYEATDQIAKALEHGEAYARLAPAVSHAQHMYGHDLRRVGRIEEATDRFRKAYELELAYYKAEGIPREYDWHHAHNLSLLAMCYQHQGQMKSAESMFREIVAIRPVNQRAEFYCKEWPEFLLTRNRYQEALDAARILANGKWPLARTVGRVLACASLLSLRRAPEVNVELAAAKREFASVASGERNEALSYLNGIHGEIWLGSGRRAEGAAVLEEVENRVRAARGPDSWIAALFRLELIARRAIDAGEWDVAEHAAKQMLEHDATYPGTHYLLGVLARRKGDRATALRELGEARKLWSKADPDLPELAKIREELSSAGGDGERK